MVEHCYAKIISMKERKRKYCVGQARGENGNERWRESCHSINQYCDVRIFLFVKDVSLRIKQKARTIGKFLSQPTIFLCKTS